MELKTLFTLDAFFLLLIIHMKKSIFFKLLVWHRVFSKSNPFTFRIKVMSI